MNSNIKLGTQEGVLCISVSQATSRQGLEATEAFAAIWVPCTSLSVLFSLYLCLATSLSALKLGKVNSYCCPVLPEAETLFSNLSTSLLLFKARFCMGWISQGPSVMSLWVGVCEVTLGALVACGAFGAVICYSLYGNKESNFFSSGSSSIIFLPCDPALVLKLFWALILTKNKA